ncbi:hypothetical protein PSACC_01508 [Paramicrosporidium saccamoebae]|uniref:Uncharacterized protein n=1 Tax=Paramicrosporidium saccamoebae TaxID=1246581 RepID=A0A2H9TLR8_9FUNG|nr:hypothetical protein PSACC_01508 [Paramicrosporidium saccamoebae]
MVGEVDGNLTVFEPEGVKPIVSGTQQKKTIEKDVIVPSAVKAPAKALAMPWGVRKIIDPYRDIVFLTIAGKGQFRELRDLVGSIHRWRPLVSQHPPIIHVFAHGFQRREIDEMTLWRNVVYQDIKDVLTPYGIFEGMQALNKTEDLNSVIDREIFSAEGEKSLRATLISRMVQMHGHAVFLKTGNAMWAKTFGRMREKLKTDGYFRLNSCYGEVIAEGYVAEMEPFRCEIQAIWDPYLAKGCAEWESRLELASDFGIDQVAPRDDEDKINMCNLCFRDDAHHGWRFFKDRRPPIVAAKKPLKRVALAFPTTSRGVTNFWDLPFLGIFLPTLARSLGWKDLRRYELSLYLGYDDGDPVYENRELMKRIVGKAKATFRNLGIPNVRLNFVRLGVSGAVAYIWNVLFSMAMADGCQYFYQVNDDLRFSSFGWLHTFASQLDRQQGLGVVGPNDPVFDCKIMTMTMVTRTHWQIFGWYFPPEFRNWQCDTWLTLVYATYMRCFQKMVIWNGRYSNLGYLPRYTPCKKASFKPLTLHYQKRLKNADGVMEPSMWTNATEADDPYDD